MTTCVIIPVYNAFEDALECLHSVMKYSDEAAEILIVDDASPQGEFEDMIPRNLLSDGRLRIHRNSTNLGFVGSCNFAMNESSPHDVVLLNSDTIVSKNWLEKLAAAAYSREEIGTVTPFTNNGTICSIPNFAEDNSIPAEYSFESFSALVESSSNREYPSLPTCVGFCVFIKREILNIVGFFDHETFGLGYGEENDFSCRAQALGYQDVLDDATYIYHKGSCSFAETKQVLVDRNTEALRKKHPHYFDTVARFCHQDPLREVRNRILDELTIKRNQDRPKRILHVLQNGPFRPRGDALGGTELHVRDLIDAVDQVSHWSLVPSKRCYFLCAHVPGAEREFVLDLHATSLEAIFKPEFFDLIHLHHSRYIDHNEICKALVSHGNYMVSFHDFITVCPRFHLYTPFRKLCNGHECAKSCGYSNDYINEYRESSRELFQNAKKLVCFSESTKSHVLNIIDGDFNWQQQSHSILNVDRDRGINPHHRLPPSKEKPLKVCFLGYIPQHKGSLLIEQIIKQSKLDNGTALEWHVVGKLFLDAGDSVVSHGEYSRENLHEMLERVRPDLVAILSICPETYCLTLDEAWNASIPVLVTPYGAPAERVAATQAGWVLPELSVASFFDCLEKMTNDWQSYVAVCEKISKTEIFSVQEEGANYTEMYKESLLGTGSQFELLLNYLRRFGLRRPPEPSMLYKLAGATLSKLIYCLDALQIRGHVQRAATAMLPKRFLEELKSSR